MFTHTREEKDALDTTHLEVRDLAIKKSGFTFKGRLYNYSEVVSLYFVCFKQTINLMTSTYVFLTIKMFDGTKATVNSTVSLFHKNTQQNIMRAHAIIDEVTYSCRKNIYINKLRSCGYIEYNNGTAFAIPLISKWKSVIIRADGTVQQGSTCINLRTAKEKGFLVFGTACGRNTNPHEIAMSETKKSCFNRIISFVADWDTDIIFGIIRDLSEGKQF